MLIFWFVLTFVFGAAIGSFLNVCIYRIPYEKSILWPASCCGHCYQPIRWYDNVPLLSYWLLRGKCRTCGTSFSMRYFFVELGTAGAFTGLFYLEVVRNALQIPFLAEQHPAILEGEIPLAAGYLFVYHALLLCFLIVTSLCDADHMEVPLNITVTGTIVGIIGGTLLPWPYPNVATFVADKPIPSGVFHWPLWNPRDLPAWMSEGTWQLGLATSLGGALMGMLLLRAVRAIYGLVRGIEGMGMGDSDLMMMAGSFLGWQPILVAFFVSVFPGLVLAIVFLVVTWYRGLDGFAAIRAVFFDTFRQFFKRERPGKWLRGNVQQFKRLQHKLRGKDGPPVALPFVPPLALGVLLTLFFWPPIGEHFKALFFDLPILGILAVFCAVLLFAITFVFRLLRGRGE